MHYKPIHNLTFYRDYRLIKLMDNTSYCPFIKMDSRSCTSMKILNPPELVKMVKKEAEILNGMYS